MVDIYIQTPMPFKITTKSMIVIWELVLVYNYSVPKPRLQNPHFQLKNVGVGNIDHGTISLQ